MSQSTIQKHEIVKPKTHRGRIFLEGRAPKLVENDKRTIFVRGENANNTVLQAMKDFQSLKKPHCVFFNKKNAIKPLEDASSLEFFSEKNDASLFMFASHSKKRPNNLVAGRMFDHRVLDMFEFGIEDFQSLKEFKNAKVLSGNKPMLLFTGEFDAQPEYKRIKNFFMDFFRGPAIEYVNLKGLEHLMVFALVKDTIHLRSYRVSREKSEENGPGLGLEEIGPHMNLILRRSKLASDDHFKKACRKPDKLKVKKVKNVSKDPFGSTHGRIHMGRQDYNKLQTRKMKGLKQRKGEKRSQKQNGSGTPAKKMKFGA